MLNLYKLEQRIEQGMQKGHVPGLALAIVKDQEVIYARGFGVTSVEDGGAPITPQTLFRIGSTTKPMTGTAIMRLVEAGKLDLDRPVKEYIDWLTLSEEDVAGRVTLRMLMSHTAGLPTAAEHFGRRDREGLEAFVRERIPRFPLIAPPGKLFSYSNPGICFAGYIAEVVSGKPFVELMQELVFDPLEMNRTTFDPTVAMTYPLAQSHDLKQDGTLSVQHRFADNVAHYPAGFVMSTVLDLANFAMMQMHQGCFRDRQVLSPESVSTMQASQVDLYTLTGTGYGLTFGVDTYKELRRVGHDGGISTFVSRFDMLPDEDVAVIMLFNRGSMEFESEGIVNSIFDELLGLPEEIPGPQEVEAERSYWPRYSGSYLGQWVGLATVRTSEDHLALDLNGKIIPLKALRQDLYFGERPESKDRISVGFVPEVEGPTQYILIDGNMCRRIERDRPFEADPAAWSGYAGVYASEGLDTYTVGIKDGHLVIHSQVDNAEVKCFPLDKRRFACEWGFFEFLVDDNGVATSVKQGDMWTFSRMS